MTPIEWMAAIIALIAVIKILVILIKPSVWMNMVVKPIYSNPIVLMIVALILATGSLWYLLESVTIVQIFAVMFFLSMLALMTAAIYASEVIAVANKMLKTKKFLSKAWLSIIVWLVLAVWVLTELFM